MICPMSIANSEVSKYGPRECEPDCAWLMEDHTIGRRYCAAAISAATGTAMMGFSPVNSMGEEQKEGE